MTRRRDRHAALVLSGAIAAIAAIVAVAAVSACTGEDPVLTDGMSDAAEAGRADSDSDGATGDGAASDGGTEANDAGDANATLDGACGVLDLKGGTAALQIDETAVDATTSFTIEAWIRPAALTPGATYNIVDRWQTGSIGSFGLQLIDGFAVFRVNCTGAGVGATVTSKGEGFRAKAAEWMHIAGVLTADATLDTGTIRVFTNGYNSAGPAQSVSCRRPVSVAEPLRVAGSVRTPGAPFTGHVDDVRLSSGVRYDYVGGNPDGGPPDFPLVRPLQVDPTTLSLYRFTEIGQTTTFDATPPDGGGAPRSGILAGNVTIASDCSQP